MMKRFWVIQFKVSVFGNSLPLYYTDYGGLFALVLDQSKAKPFVTKSGADMTLKQMEFDKPEVMRNLPRGEVVPSGFD